MMGIDTRSQQTLGFYYDTDLWVIDTRTGDPVTHRMMISTAAITQNQHSSQTIVVKKEIEKFSAKANELYKEQLFFLV